MSTGLSIAEILAQSEADGTPVPDEVQAKGESAIRAYATMRIKIRTTETENQKLREELDSFRKEKAERDAVKPTVTQNNSQVDAIWEALEQRAMANFGIVAIRTQKEQRMVDAEASRLYSDGISTFRRESELKTTAPKIMADKLSAYGLSDADSKAISDRVSKYPISQQVDDTVIRNEVYRYVGEKQLSPETIEPEDDSPAIEFNDDGNTQPDAQTDRSSNASVVSSARVAASSVRNGRPNGGVTVASRKVSPGPKPATTAELQEMRKMGFVDLKAYRYAKENKAKYAGR